MPENDKKTGTDEFGIEQFYKTTARLYEQSARRTGRSNTMMARLKDGDRVIFMDRREADRVKRICKGRGLEVTCIVLPTSDPQNIFSRQQPTGRTIFDHSWVEQFYRDAIDRAARDLDYFQQQSSGFGQAHHESREKYEMIWRRQQ